MIQLYANEKYDSTMEEVRAMLKDIDGLLKNHDIKSGSRKHYGHVGDLHKVAVSLTEIERFLGWAK